ncbi:serine/threonine protein kinase, CMGC family, partial [Mucor lusitanicus CBS 277.49]
YELLNQIGDGSFGSVHKARTIASNKIVAIKIMKKKLNGDHIKEYNTLKKLTTHPNIVKLYETFIDTTKDFYFVMEYMNGGNLYQFIKDRKEAFDNIQPNEVKTILFQVLSGLHHIHHVEGIFHRDMKPENLLISYDNDTLLVKLADFGLATSIKSKPPYTIYTSTRWYRAPEILLKSSAYSYPIDLWAVGTIFAELVTLRPLFPGQSEIDQLFRICQVLGSPGIGGEWKDGVKLAQKMGFQFPKISPKVDCLSSVLQPHPISNDGLDLLSKLLQFDPYKRITSSEALNHPFF